MTEIKGVLPNPPDELELDWIVLVAVLVVVSSYCSW